MGAFVPVLNGLEVSAEITLIICPEMFQKRGGGKKDIVTLEPQL
jgi:hypothetical protein